MTTRRARAIAAVLAVTGVLVVVAALPLRPDGTTVPGAASAVGQAVLALLAGAAGLWRATTRAGRARGAWLSIGIACLCWGAGEAALEFYEFALGREAPSPSVADAGFLAAVPVFAAGILLFGVPDRTAAGRARAVLDGLSIAAALLLASWVSVLGPVVRDSGTTGAGRDVLLAYPVGDVVIVTLAVHRLLQDRAGGRRAGLPVLLVGLGLIGLSLADSGYAYQSFAGTYADGSVVDLGWLAGFGALLAAALVTAPPPRADRAERPAGMLLPCLVVLAAVVFAFAADGGAPDPAGDGVEDWLRTALLVLVIARQVLSLRENAVLTHDLEQRVADRTADLARTEQRFRSLVERSSDVITLIGLDGTITFQSESARHVLGMDPADQVGRLFGERLDAESQRRFVPALSAAVSEPFTVRVIPLRVQHGDGSWRELETTVTNQLTDPAVRAVVLNFRDVSESRSLRAELERQAFHDALTGLANRALFLDRVDRAMGRRSHGDDEHVAVLLFDLDAFQDVNDSWGHGLGDELLRQVGGRLAGCVRAGDTVARLGGDEFGVLMESGAGIGDVTALARRMRALADEPYAVAGREIRLQGSIGIALAGGAPPELAGGDDAGDLIRNADLAMYRAKAQHDLDYVVYETAMHRALMDRLELEADLRTAIAAGALTVHYQPLHAIASERLIGAEALARWTHPRRGRIGPDVFVPLAEQCGLIHDLGRFVLADACTRARAWVEAAPGPFHVAVNASARQLQRPDFADEVAGILAATGLPAEHLVVEATESMMMDDGGAGIATLERIKALGVRIAIDDFGTGYSSLSYLHRLPADILKIDRSFVSRLSDPSSDGASLVRSIMQLAQSMGLETVAEGIETRAQLTVLRDLGCDTAQGYHFGRPGEPERIDAALARGAGAAPLFVSGLAGG